MRDQRGAADLAEAPAHETDPVEELGNGSDRCGVVTLRACVQVDEVARGRRHLSDDAPDIRREVGDAVAHPERGRAEKHRGRLATQRDVEGHRCPGGEAPDDDLIVIAREVVVRVERRRHPILPGQAEHVGGTCAAARKEWRAHGVAIRDERFLHVVHVDGGAGEAVQQQDRRIAAARRDRVTVPAHGGDQGTQHAYFS